MWPIEDGMKMAKPSNSDDPRPDSDQSIEITDQDAGTFKLAPKEPKLVGRAVCCIEIYDNDQRTARLEHEPDERLENLPQTKGKVSALMTISNNDEPALRVRIRICKHCGCHYAEKS